MAPREPIGPRPFWDEGFYFFPSHPKSPGSLQKGVVGNRTLNMSHAKTQRRKGFLTRDFCDDVLVCENLRVFNIHLPIIEFGELHEFCSFPFSVNWVWDGYMGL